ncbi:MAG: class I SAM-dependent rRNA methyltransferase [Pseudanabaenaceae cyanobacterium SKYGB_i_bin29]|nr:class I SAM-dependent rRNA methyltransferase [Pseudanabaenaceae cyanobacterium SKYG29]MDW8420389.1 class I SAM-dependent rRNA methyltransferase [Pseudanabaenaceae cyanobacterium SKYGB_i_bin29]
MTVPSVTVAPSLRESLQRGHPWVYRNHVQGEASFPTGTWVRVKCGSWQGFGLWDESSPIALRIFSTQQVPDRQWLHRQIAGAWFLRGEIRQQATTAYRWLYGEGDGLPGITVDVYDRYAVLQTYTAGFRTLQADIVAILPQIAPLRGILWRDHHHPPQLLWGELPPRDLLVTEYGIKFCVDLTIGQKTGLFLDHRENRRYVEGLSGGRTVLNCFAYTGGFSLYALRGGAKHVTSVDIGKGLETAIAQNIQVNGLDAKRHEFVAADCFSLLPHLVSQGRQFDLVILDPPSFAKTKQQRFAALRAYTKLNTIALQLVKPGGFLVSASCTSQVSPADFQTILADACGQAQVRGKIIHEAGQPLDHPVPVGFVEGRYLKFVVLQVTPLA